jgi:hypothetical protein
MAEQFDAATQERQDSDDNRPNPNEKLVKVFDSEQESEAMVVKGLLDSAGIQSDLASASLLQDAFPGMGGMIITVREEDAEKARALIAESQAPSSAEEADDETKSEQLLVRERRGARRKPTADGRGCKLPRLLLDGRQVWGYGVTVQVERDGSVQVGTVDAGSRVF